MSTQELYNNDAKYFGCARPEMLSYFPKEAKVALDVGCSNGSFGASLKKAFGAEVWGVDINTSAVDEAKKVLDRALCVDISSGLDGLEDQKFDVIYFNDVLEHLPNPYGLLEKVGPLLSENGRVVASIPNIRFFRVLKDILFEKDFRYQEDGVMDKTHLRFFTKKSMVRMFEEAGLQVDKVEPINRTKSFRPYLYRIFTLGLIGSDIHYPQFAVTATRKATT